MANLRFSTFQEKRKSVLLLGNSKVIVCLWIIINSRTTSFRKVIHIKNEFLLKIHEHVLETWLFDIWISDRPAYLAKIKFTRDYQPC